MRKIHQEENHEGARHQQLLLENIQRMEQEKMEMEEIKEQLEKRSQEKDEEIRILKSTHQDDDKIHAIKKSILKESKHITPLEEESGELTRKDRRRCRPFQLDR